MCLRLRSGVALGAIATALALAGSVPATAPAASPCTAPHSGYRACLRANWTVQDPGTVSRVTATVTLVQRVKRCGHHGRRRVVAHHGRTRLGAERATASCSGGVVRWRTRFSRTDTRDWKLRAGDTLTTTWGGATAAARVRLVRAKGGGGAYSPPAAG